VPAEDRLRLRGGQRGLRMEGVYIVVALTTGRQNVQQGKRHRGSRALEQRLTKKEPRKVPRNGEKIMSTQAGWRFG